MSRLRAPRNGCAVRMYRHGLGDCFLLAFGAANGHQRYVLIDCGVLLGTADATAEMTVVAENIEEATAGHLHRVVATHEHWDHISGFDQARPVFERMDVDELWVAWTEDPDNEFANQLRARRRQALNALRFALSKLDSKASRYAARIEGVAQFFGPMTPGAPLGATGRASTEDIFKWIKSTWKPHTYCVPGMDPLRISGLPDVRFFVLGPPQDRRKLWKDRPSRGQVYLDDVADDPLAPFLHELYARTANTSDSPGAANARPFANPYGLAESDSRVAPARKIYGDEPWRKIDENWLEQAGELAIKLDSHTNNTSLVLAIELGKGGPVLLFAADAQVGNWLSWQDVSWPAEDPPLHANDLLARTVLYKVGHHGSHNATLRDAGLEKMTSPDLTALIPVDRNMAERRRWRMPYGPLHERLQEATNGRVILADEGIGSADTSYLGVNERFRSDNTETELYVEHTIRT